MIVQYECSLDKLSPQIVKILHILAVIFNLLCHKTIILVITIRFYIFSLSPFNYSVKYNINTKGKSSDTPCNMKNEPRHHFLYHKHQICMWDRLLRGSNKKKKHFIYLVLEIGEGREIERERNIYWLPLKCAPAADWNRDLGMCPDRESNRLPFSLCRMRPNNWATPVKGRGSTFILFSNYSNWLLFRQPTYHFCLWKWSILLAYFPILLLLI